MCLSTILCVTSGSEMVCFVFQELASSQQIEKDISEAMSEVCSLFSAYIILCRTTFIGFILGH